jgi:hypothetical protein
MDEKLIAHLAFSILHGTFNMNGTGGCSYENCCIGQAMLYLAGLVAGGMLVTLAFAYRVEREKNLKRRFDNPRCFCPDCGADLGNFYSNRIQMERVPGGF